MFELTGMENSGFRNTTRPSVLEELQRKAQVFPRGPATLADITNLFTCSTNRSVTMNDVKQLMDMLLYRSKDYMANQPDDVFVMDAAMRNMPTIEKVAYYLEKENMTCDEIADYFRLKMI